MEAVLSEDRRKETINISGWLYKQNIDVSHDYGESKKDGGLWFGGLKEGRVYDVLHVRPDGWQDGKPILEFLYEDCLMDGAIVDVSYAISNTPMTFEAVQEDIIKLALGEADVDFGHHFSDLTGYLWTDSDLKIGGHDLLNELESFEGKYCNIRIVMHHDLYMKSKGVIAMKSIWQKKLTCN